MEKVNRLEKLNELYDYIQEAREILGDRRNAELEEYIERALKFWHRGQEVEEYEDFRNLMIRAFGELEDFTERA